MRTLIIPDIHNRCQWAEDVILHEEREGGPIDEIVFLGDYFDSFGDGPFDAAATADWLLKSVKDTRRFHLLGNHDASYLHYDLRCSGYNRSKQAVIDGRPEVKELLRTFATEYRVGPWLLSHAGVGQRFATWRSINPKTKLFDGMNRVTPVGWIGSDSGGYDPYSGPLWHRPWEAVTGNDCYAPEPQLFGHTKGVSVRLFADSSTGVEVESGKVISPYEVDGFRELPVAVCLDTNQRHYGVVEHEDGFTLPVKELPSEA